MQKVKRNLISKSEYAVLNNLNQKYHYNKANPASDISQISIETGIRNNDEVLRALYTLEGKSLVSPEPKGSFTSNIWKITDIGLKAVELVEQEK